MSEPQVLFVCVRNAGRSKMAAALRVMAEVGVDLSAAFPQAVTERAVEDSDVVVTMGCGEACPIHPGKRYEDWSVEDPAGKDVETVRGIRDEIDRRARLLVADLTAA